MAEERIAGPVRRLAGELSAIARTPVIYPLIALTAALALALSTHGFLSAQNIRSVLSVVSVTGIAAVGLTAITVSGNLFSVSTAAVATAAAICYARLLGVGVSVEFSLAISLLLALLLGLIQGAIVAAGMNPIVTTLAVGGALQGLAPIASQNQVLELNTASGAWIGQASIAGIPVTIFEFVLVTLCCAVLMGQTRAGRRLYLVGANRRAALVSGLRPGVAACIAFAGASVAVGLAGIAASAQVGLVTPTALDTMTFDTITAVIVGGAAIQGGRGSPIATAVAAIFVGTVTNVVELHGYSYGVQLAVEGSLVCIAVVGYAMMARLPE